MKDFLRMCGALALYLVAFLVFVVLFKHTLGKGVQAWWQPEENVPRETVHGDWQWVEQNNGGLVVCYQHSHCYEVQVSLSPKDSVTASYHGNTDKFVARKFYSNRDNDPWLFKFLDKHHWRGL